jgi:hypothetical protein
MAAAVQEANKAHFDAEAAGYDKKWAPVMRVVEGAAARIAAEGGVAGKARAGGRAGRAGRPRRPRRGAAAGARARGRASA